MISAYAEETTDLILAEEARLRRLARRLTRCESDADDLVQDTLMRAFRARDRFEPGTSMRAWTVTILRRVFLTEVVRAKRRRVETDTDAGEPIGRLPGVVSLATGEAPKIEAVVECVDDCVKHALDRVPEVYRVPFLLSALDDLTCTEIAARLGIPEGTVMSRIHRARERMKLSLVRAPAPESRRALAS